MQHKSWPSPSRTVGVFYFGNLGILDKIPDFLIFIFNVAEKLL